MLNGRRNIDSTERTGQLLPLDPLYIRFHSTMTTLENDSENAENVSKTTTSANETAPAAHQIFPELTETLMLSKPLGVRIHKRSMKIVYVDPQGPSRNKAAVGDTLMEIDGVAITNSAELNAALRSPTSEARVKFRRNAHSQCQHKCTTVETLIVKNEPKVMRAVELFSVRLTAHEIPKEEAAISNELFGLSVVYDAKERVQVKETAEGSLSEVHLRPQDIIREVNGHALASKTMLQFWLMKAIEKDESVQLLIEAAAGGEEPGRDVDMPTDVIDIAKKQLKVLRSISGENALKAVLRSRNSNFEKTYKVVIDDKSTEYLIESDYDEKTLKKVKKGQH